jgi:hypothetical protein
LKLARVLGKEAVTSARTSGRSISVVASLWVSPSGGTFLWSPKHSNWSPSRFTLLSAIWQVTNHYFPIPILFAIGSLLFFSSSCAPASTLSYPMYSFNPNFFFGKIRVFKTQILNIKQINWPLEGETFILTKY